MAFTALLAVGGLGYAGAAGALTGEVLPGTHVAGIDIGGMSAAEAETAVSKKIADAAAKPLTAEIGRKRVQLSPGKIGLSVDVRATVASAGTGWPSPAGVLRSFFGRRDLPVQVKVDEERLKTGIAALAKTVDKPASEGRVVYQGLEPRAQLPKTGQTLDQAETMKVLRAAYLRPRSPLKLPLTVVQPKVSAAEVRRVAATTARIAVAAPLTLTNGSRKATLTSEAIAANLRFVPDGQDGLRPSFDASGIAPQMQTQLIGKDQAPKDATFKIVSGKPRVVPSQPGQTIDAQALARSVAGAIKTEGNRTVAIAVTDGKPRLTTEEAEKLGVTEKVSSFTTKYPCCAPRVTNIHRIAEIVDGYVVKPGETFSLNGLVGKRDKARGFVEAPMILNGRFVNDVGGGVSQFATTMFNAVFFGGFEDVQHTPHSYYISRYPAGRESTVSFPQPDFRWRNDSPYGVLINASYTDTSVTVQFWSTKRFDIESQSSERYDVKSIPTLSEPGEKCIPMDGVEGFSIDVWRVFKKDGQVVRRQKFHTVYMPEPRLTCRLGA